MDNESQEKQENQESQGKKVALITGSTSGIGLAIAKQLALDGYNIALNSSVEKSEAKEAIKQVEENTSLKVQYFQIDLAKHGAGTELVRDVISKFGRLDVLVNNAGVQKVSSIEDLDINDYNRIRAISLDASFETIKAALCDMKSRKWGRIINIASIHGLVASKYKSAYVAAKHGLLGLTKTAALEVAQDNITVNAICPGYVLTPLVEKQLKDQMQVHGLSKKQVIDEIMLANQPTKQFIEPQEIACLASYLCSDIAKSITGTSIAIDGGWTAR